MFTQSSIQAKHSFVFMMAIILMGLGFYLGVQDLKLKQLRNEARAVAEQVVSFRAWVANSGVVWVDQLSADFHDYLGEKMVQEGEKIFSKNPALATRELSTIVAKSSTRATFRVTSDDYRNPINAPDEFEKRALRTLKEESGQGFVENIGNGKYFYAQPIYVKKSCLRCHGDPKDAPRDVIEKYGDKRAFGYKVGDVRGIISVALPDVRAEEVASSFINPVTLGLIAVAFLMSYLYTHFSLIQRIKSLTKKTKLIAKGELNTPLEAQLDSSDEIEHATHAVDLLRRSLIVSMRHMHKED